MATYEALINALRSVARGKLSNHEIADEGADCILMLEDKCAKLREEVGRLKLQVEYYAPKTPDSVRYEVVERLREALRIEEAVAYSAIQHLRINGFAFDEKLVRKEVGSALSPAPSPAAKCEVCKTCGGKGYRNHAWGPAPCPDCGRPAPEGRGKG